MLECSSSSAAAFLPVMPIDHPALMHAFRSTLCVFEFVRSQEGFKVGLARKRVTRGDDEFAVYDARIVPRASCAI